jgi:uncharacterized protein
LGTMYEAGEGVERNLSDATKWYARAAKQGHQKALQNLSKLHE